MPVMRVLAVVHLAASMSAAAWLLPSGVVKRDTAGNIYVAGSTNLDNVGVTPNAFQTKFQPVVCQVWTGSQGSRVVALCPHGFVAKISPSGDRIIWATYLGGNYVDHVNDLEVDSEGNVLVTGYTGSTDFPVTPGTFHTEKGSNFLTKLSRDGDRLIFSAVFGGASGNAMRLDKEGAIYLAGTGQGGVVVRKLDPAATRVIFSSLLGGNFSGRVACLRLGHDKTIFLAGYTDLPDFPHTGGDAPVWASQGFIARVSADGSALLYSTLFGGTNYETVVALALDGQDRAYFTGVTESLDLPVTPGAWRKQFSRAYAGSVGTDGALRYLTYLGTDRDRPAGIEVDDDGTAWIAGESGERFPTTPDSERPCGPGGRGSQPYFAMVLDPSGSHQLYGTFVDEVEALLAPGLIWRNRYSPFGHDVHRLGLAAPGTLTCAANGADFSTHAAAPGMIVSLFGNSIGPEITAGPQFEPNGDISKTLAGTQVLVDGMAAPLLYVSRHQINAVLPFGIAGKTRVTITVEPGGASREMDVKPSAPAFFSLDGSGVGLVAALNQDGSQNSPEHPAKRGDIVSFFVTGIGEMIPTPPDGSRPLAITSKPVLPLRLTLERGLRYGLEITYAGNAPGLVEGLVQINAKLPDYPQYGPVYLNLTAGDATNGTTAALYLE